MGDDSRNSNPLAVGQILITRNALKQVGHKEALNALGRHAHGDWGELDEHDRRANEQALKDGSRLFSVYITLAGVKFYIITEADRSVTTVLLPEDY